MFQGSTHVTGVRDTEGTLRATPSKMDQILWDSRSAIWDTSPPLPRPPPTCSRRTSRSDSALYLRGPDPCGGPPSP
eukprot:10554310-Alexandrium_andersonii.AAC.1